MKTGIKLFFVSMLFFIVACGDGGEYNHGTPKGNSNNTTSIDTSKIVGWGTPPEIVTPSTNEQAKEMLNKSTDISDLFMNDLIELRKSLECNLFA